MYHGEIQHNQYQRLRRRRRLAAGPRTRCCALARPIRRAPESCQRCMLFFQTWVVTLTPTSLTGCAGAVDQLRGHRLFRGCEETCGGTLEKEAERFSL
jgi:hypothetical protein